MAQPAREASRPLTSPGGVLIWLRRPESIRCFVMESPITDIWFRSSLSLPEIGKRLEMTVDVHDSENYWEWIIGEFNGERLDVTRAYRKARSKADTRIFLLDKDHFSETLLDALLSKLRSFVSGTISCGQWKYISGNDFDLIPVLTSDPTNPSDHPS